MKTNDRFKSNMLKKMLSRCLVLAVISAVILVAAAYAVLYIAHNLIIWQPTPLYWLLQGMYQNKVFVLATVWISVVCAIIYYYWRKTLGYMEDIAEASKPLSRPLTA